MSNVFDDEYFLRKKCLANALPIQQDACEVQ